MRSPRSPRPRRPPLLVSTAACAACAVCATFAAGCGGEPCALPTVRLQLSMPEELRCDTQPHLGRFDGVFHPADGGFAIETFGLALTFTGPEPAIPDGTFIRLTFGCFPAGVFKVGRFFSIQNLPSLDGVPNSTEAGSRTWYTMAAGGPAPLPEVLPLPYALELECLGTGADDGLESESFIPISADPVVIVKPGAKGAFHVPYGEQAGGYEVENANITFAVNKGNELPVDINFRIIRAD